MRYIDQYQITRQAIPINQLHTQTTHNDPIHWLISIKSMIHSTDQFYTHYPTMITT